MSEDAGIAEQAVVSSKAELGKDVAIGPFTVIEGAVRIGDNVKIGPQCYIRDGTTLEEHCVIESGAKIGIIPKAVKMGENTGVVIGKYATIGENVTVERATVDGKYTSVGQNSWVLPGAHVGHNSEIGRFVFLTNGVKLAGHVFIDDFTVLGGDVGVHQFVSIGKAAFIGGGVKVSKDVVPYAWLAHDGKTKVYGVNAIALRRSGATTEQIKNVKAAYTVLKECATLDDRLHWLSVLDTEEAQHIAAFLNRSTRGAYAVAGNRLINPAALYKNRDAYQNGK